MLWVSKILGPSGVQGSDLQDLIHSKMCFVPLTTVLTHSSSCLAHSFLSRITLHSSGARFVPSTKHISRYSLKMPKRKSTHSAGVEDAPPRRSTRQRTSTSTSTSISKSAATSTTSTPIPKVKAKSPRAKLESSKPTKTTPTTAAQATGAKGKPAQTEEAASPAPAADDSKPQTNGTGRSNPRGTQAPGAAAAAAPREGTNTAGRQYWLMKAEPETRYENGVDVSFSIDDLAAKTEPEPWDGRSQISSHLISSHFHTWQQRSQ